MTDEHGSVVKIEQKKGYIFIAGEWKKGGCTYQEHRSVAWMSVLAYRRDGHICQSCGEKRNGSREVHHIRPKSEGGGNCGHNLITLCRKCHSTTLSMKRGYGGVPNEKAQMKLGGEK